MSNRVPVATIARLYSEGHSSMAIVNALYREAGVKLSTHNIDMVVQGLLKQQTAMKLLPAPPPLPDFIPQISPKFTPPRHLKPFTDLFEQIGQKPMRVVGHAPPRHSKCQPAGSPVLLTDGRSVPIESVRRGDRVVTLLADRTLSESVVLASGSNGLKAVLRLHLYSGRTIDCTENHPLLTIHGWQEAELLREGGSIATARELPCPDGAALPSGYAALMGYLVGDGSFGRGQPIVTTADPDVLAHLESIAAQHGWKLTKDGKYTYHIRRQNRFTPRSDGSSAVEGMRKFGMVPGTSHTKLVPPCLFTASRADVLAFLAAYFNCDGTVNDLREGVAQYASVHRALLLQTQELLLRFRIFSTIRARDVLYRGEKRPYWVLSVSGEDVVHMAAALPVVGVKGDKLCRMAQRIQLRRHFPVFESIPCGWRELMKTTPHWMRKHYGLRIDKKYTQGTARMLVQQVADIENNAALRELCAPALAWERITKIEHLGEVPTYGISVKKTKNYISGGVISHNTETILHAVAHVLRKDPSLLCGYSTYAMDLTFSKSVHARELAQKAGVKLSRKAAKEWRTIDGGGLLATSTGGPLTGHGISGAMFIDDAYKNRVQAESKNIRNTIWDWFSDVVMTRLEPGASVFILMTRWHQDDLGGRALRELGKHRRGPEGQRYCKLDCPGCGPNPIDGFEEIRLPAIDDFGNPLWIERWPLEALEARRREVTAYTWFSLYQGIPRARGTNVFSGLTFYDPDQMPAAGFRITIGIDLSYTESTSADWAVAVVLMKYGAEYWVLEVVREQTTAPKFALKLKDLRKRYKRAPMFSIFYGPEKGSIDFMRTLGVPIKGLKRPGDKFVRSQPTAAKWNDGKILVPHVQAENGDHALIDGRKTCLAECRGCRWPWLDPFVEVITGFTGVKDDCDDDVDALVAAVEGMPQSTEAIIETVQAMVNTRALPNMERRDPRDRSGGFGPADI